jgi:hypothetical protein
MVRDITLSGLEKSQYRYYRKKEQPDALGVGVGLRTPEKGVEFFHRKPRGSYACPQMQSPKIFKSRILEKRKRRPFSQAAFFV